MTPTSPHPLPYPATLEQNLLTFARGLREHDLLVGPQESALALSALGKIDLGDAAEVRTALKSIFATTPQEGLRFEKLFDLYWGGGLLNDEEQLAKPQLPPKPQGASGVSMVDWDAGAKGEDTVDTYAYSADEVVAEEEGVVLVSEVEVLGKLVRRLAKRLATKKSRRWTPSSRRGEVADLRRTIRHSLSRGGELLELRYKRRELGKTRIVFVFDVSGSMMVYSHLLLQLAYAFVRETRLSRTEVFGFSTDLYRLTPHLERGGVAEAIRAARLAMPGRSGGTKIGAALSALLERHGTFIDSKTVVIINSDGWDTGDLDVLHGAMRSLQERSNRVIWLNPLAASPGYEPTASGMKTALPFVDVFAPSHNLASLQALEQALGKVS